VLLAVTVGGLFLLHHSVLKHATQWFQEVGLPRLVGYGKALQLVLTGEVVDAVSAYEIGLLDEIVPGVELRERTLEIARSMAEKSPVTLALAKRALRAACEMPLSAGLTYERELFALAFATEDKEEGVRAFLEKRPPEWKGR